MEKKTFLIAVVAFVVGILIIALLFIVMVSLFETTPSIVSPPIGAPSPIKDVNDPKHRLIGGDKDDHGCLIAAGYSWCDSKQKCLRVWEEPCDDTTTPPYEEPENDDGTCAVKNCHGLDVSCGLGGAPQVCTDMYQAGDKCLQYASCEMVGDQCRQAKSPKFDACKSCVEACEKQYPNDPSSVFDCESRCE